MVHRSASIPKRSWASCISLGIVLGATATLQADDGVGTFLLESHATKQVTIDYSFTVSAPRLDAKEWVVYVARPPDLPGQRVKNIQVQPAAEPVFDPSLWRRPLLCFQVPVGEGPPGVGPNSFVGQVEYRVELIARRLVPRAPGEGPQERVSLAGRERTAALDSSELLDFRSEEFGRWIERNALHRRPGEENLALARRTFLTIKRQFRYDYRGEMDRRASRVAAAGHSDCGGLAVLFVSAMRLQQIPARLLVGRWAISARAWERVGEFDYSQQHVKAEFFVPELGWIPVDLSSAILHDPDPGGLKFFGRDEGDFLTMHVDPTLELDTIHFGKSSIHWLQGAAYWARGGGRWEGHALKDGWQVR